MSQKLQSNAWKKCALEDLVFFQRGFDISQHQQFDGPYPVISSSGVTSYHNAFKVNGPGVIIGRKGTLGSIHFTTSDYWPHSTTLWSKHLKGNNPKFVFYFLHTLDLKRFDVGSSNPTLNRNHIHGLSIQIPHPDIQLKIASILSAYDDLIENNRRRMELLEESARLLYREWFVHLRFPGHARTCVTDGVPKGWQLLELDKLAGIVMGQSPESKFYNETGNGLPFHQGVADFGDRFVSNRIFTSEQTRIAEANSILCSVRAPVGRLNVTLEKIAIGRGLAALNSRTGHQSLLMYQLRNHFFKEDLIGSGSIFASVAKKELFGQKLLTPPQQLADKFEALSLPIDNQLRVLYLQNQKLRTARDLLLPRLMSGEIAP